MCRREHYLMAQLLFLPTHLSFVSLVYLYISVFPSWSSGSPCARTVHHMRHGEQRLGLRLCVLFFLLLLFVCLFHYPSFVLSAGLEARLGHPS